MGIVSDTWKDKLFKDERLKNLQQLAKANKCNFIATEKFVAQKLPLKAFQIFKSKKGKRLRGIIISKEKEIPCTGRMYDFISYDGRKKKTTTVIELYSSKLNLHRFEIKPKGKLNKFKEMFLKEEQEFLLADEFYANYNLVYNHKKSIKLNLNEDVLRLVTSRNHLTVEGDEKLILLYYHNQVIPATELKNEFAFAVQLLQEILEHQTLMELD